MKRAWIAVLCLGVMVVVGCGGGGGGGGSSSGPASPPAPVLASIVVAPALAEIDRGGSQAFSATAVWSDGSTTPADVIWSSSDPAKAPVDASGNASGLAGGVYAMTARSVANPSIAGQAELTVVAPPPVVYAFDHNRGLLRYAIMGGDPQTLPFAPADWGITEVEGLCASGSYLYLLRTGWPAEIHRFDPVTGGLTLVTEVPETPGVTMCLAADAAGRLYTSGLTEIMTASDIFRYDPVGGTIGVFASVPMNVSMLLVDDAGNVWGGGLMGGGVFRVAPSGTVTAMPMSDLTWAGGVARTGTGDVFVEDLLWNSLYRGRDLNSDGDFLDAGETILAIAPGVLFGQVWGLCWTGSSLLLNAGDIHELRDLDGDGEVSTWSSPGLLSGFDSGVMRLHQP